MTQFPSAVSMSALSDAAAVKSAVLRRKWASQRERRLTARKSPVARYGRHQSNSKIIGFRLSAPDEPAHQRLWMNRKSYVCKNGVIRQSRSSILSNKHNLPLAANNSATTKAQQSTEDSAKGEAAATAQAKSSDPSAELVKDEELDAASEKADEEPAVAENRAMALSNSMSRRMRQQLGKPRVKSLRPATVEANMNLVKQHRHPSQQINQIKRLEHCGITRNQQILSQKRQREYLAKAVALSQKKKKKSKADEEDEQAAEADYPDWIPFRLRFRRKNSKAIWDEIVAHRKDLSKELGERALCVIKATDRYSEDYIDLWTNTLTIQVRPVGLLQDVLRPVLARLGLEGRADLRLTIGCFPNDTRQGGQRIRGMPKTAVSVSVMTPVIELYKMGITELFVSSWPDFRNGFPKGYFNPQLTPSEANLESGGSAAKAANASNKNFSLLKRFLRDSQRAAAHCEETAATCCPFWWSPRVAQGFKNSDLKCNQNL